MGHGHGFDQRPVQIERPAQQTAHSYGVDSLVHHAVNDFPKPLHEHKVTAAFGAQAAHKYVRLLASSDNVIVLNTLRAVKEYLQGHPNNGVRLIEAGGLPALLDLLKHDDTKARELACLCVEGLCDSPNRVATASADRTVNELVAAILSNSGGVRRAASSALCAVVSCSAGAHKFVVGGHVSTALEFVKENASGFLMHSLFHCFGEAEGRDAGLASDAIQICTTLLGKQKEFACLEWTLRCLFRLAIPHPAKSVALQCGAVDAVCKCLSHGCLSVRRSAAEALMVIAADVASKKAAVDGAQCAAPLLSMITESDSTVQLAAVQAIMTVAEANRRMFMGGVPRLDDLTANAEDELVRRHAERAAKVVRWKP